MILPGPGSDTLVSKNCCHLPAKLACAILPGPAALHGGMRGWRTTDTSHVTAAWVGFQGVVAGVVSDWHCLPPRAA